MAATPAQTQARSCRYSWMWEKMSLGFVAKKSRPWHLDTLGTGHTVAQAMVQLLGRSPEPRALSLCFR